MDNKYHLVVLVIYMRKWHMQTMENLEKLALISGILKLFNLKLMCFNDLHLFVNVAIWGYKLHSYIKFI